MADASCPVIEQENVRIGQTLVGSAVSAATMTGETPMGYLSRWRLNRAALWLRSNDSTLAQVATRVGAPPLFKTYFYNPALRPYQPTRVRACKRHSPVVREPCQADPSVPFVG